MRVRFAPSPTGALHIGGVRTALYNYLLAKKHGGTFILRIEDTDQTRYVEGAEQYIIDALEWLGLEFDESPSKGGAYGPYRQSERKATGIYEKFANQLIENGHGYYAYDTEEELTEAREKAEAQGTKFKYDAVTRMQMKNSLSLSAEECKALEAEGAPKIVRVMIPAEGNVTFEDMVRGVVTFNCAEMDDKVMLKNDGMPTYHLANIVDDYHMKITHVIRGEEWLPSTPLHVLLYQFLGWADAMPIFAHLPLILKPEPTAYLNKRSIQAFTERFTNEFLIKHTAYAAKKDQVAKTIQPLLQDFKNVSERIRINEKKDSNLQKEIKLFLRNSMYGKLSKRDGDRLGMPVFPLDWKGETEADSFRGFREWGFLSEAVLNILALLGWNDGTEQEIYSKEEMINSFTMDRVSSSGARFNFEKAKWFNKQYLAQMENADLVVLVRPTLDAHKVVVEEKKLERIAELLKMRINYTTDFYAQGSYFFNDLDLEAVAERHQKNFQKKILNKWGDEQKAFMNRLIEIISSADHLVSIYIEAILEPTIADRKGEILPILRLGLSGEMGGPSIYEIMEVLGKNETIKRLLAFIDFCEKKLVK
ncbi:glutamate--tRNA ligase [Aureispira anguillae]|uniref:Glutamate--tRNA ligase n=1 Tax=Aureispira anguillae TaxID=2864201 RepID=A0A916DVA6_9BACT|nr:glutamate--tRNA ligase [Aureispira anguillae]BDS13345.1 glutamate--tRNA ligase [Aureispira anguillae]